MPELAGAKASTEEGSGAAPRAVRVRLHQHSCFLLHEWLPDIRSLAQGPQRHCPPTPGRCSHEASLITLQREGGREARGGHPCAPPQPFLLPRRAKESPSPPHPHRLPAQLRSACQPAPGTARPLQPRRWPRGRMGPRKAWGRRPGPGSSCAARPAWPPSSEAARSGWMVGGVGERRGSAGTAGEGVRRVRDGPQPRPRAPRRSPAPGPPRRRARGERRPAVLGRPFIPARSAEARPTRTANPRPRVAAAPARERGTGYRRSEPGKRRVRPG